MTMEPTVTTTGPVLGPYSTLPWYIPTPPSGMSSQVAPESTPPTVTVTLWLEVSRAL
jgi:hypothetical protein